MSAGSANTRRTIQRLSLPIGQCVIAGAMVWFAGRHGTIPLIVPYLLVMLGFGLFDGYLRRDHPNVFVELRRGDVPLSDRLTFLGGGLLLLLHFVVAIADTSRMHWTEQWPGAIPLPWRVAGLVGMTGGYLFASWAMLLNPFFSPIVRVQDERGHRVVTTGPYAWVRHPAYSGIGFGSLLSGVALGSFWSILPVLGFLLVYARRVVLEERKLAAELPGFAEYAQRVRYRLAPGIW